MSQCCIECAAFMETASDPPYVCFSIFSQTHQQQMPKETSASPVSMMTVSTIIFDSKKQCVAGVLYMWYYVWIRAIRAVLDADSIAPLMAEGYTNAY